MGIGLGRLVGLLALGLLAACSHESPEAPRREASIEMKTLAPSFTDAETLTRAEPGDEPAWAPSGYYLYDDLTGSGSQLLPNTHAGIGSFFTKDDQETLHRSLAANSSGNWFIQKVGSDAQDDMPNAGNYLLYAYVPNDAASASITGYNGTNATFSNGARLTLTGLNSVMNKDVCVAVGAKHATAYTADPEAYTFGDGALTPGDFSTTLGAESHLFLLFDHIYAAIRFRFRIDNSAPYYYASLRAIKLRKLDLMAFQDEACEIKMKSSLSTTIRLKANGTGANPIEGELTFTPDPLSDDMDWVTIFEGNSLLPKAPGSYTDEIGFVPKTSSYYLLRATYDVYDLDDSGNPKNLIRPGCVAENKINPRKQFNQESLDRGYIYTLRITVKPTYLYVLSDEDLNKPEMKMD